MNEPALQRILQDYEGEFFLTAVGARVAEFPRMSEDRSGIYVAWHGFRRHHAERGFEEFFE